MHRPRVGDDAHGASDAEPVQVLAVALQLGGGHGFVDPARLEEAIELGAGREAEQPAREVVGNAQCEVHGVSLPERGFLVTAAALACWERPDHEPKINWLHVR